MFEKITLVNIFVQKIQKTEFMAGFELGTCQVSRFYKGVIAKKFWTECPFFLKIAIFLHSFRYKMYKIITYTGVRTPDLWIRNFFVLPTGLYKM